VPPCGLEALRVLRLLTGRPDGVNRKSVAPTSRCYTVIVTWL
jgi:hypothetical protein